MKRNDELRGHVASLLRDWTASEVLEAFAAEAAYWKREEKSAAWGAVRDKILKTAELAREVGL